MVAAATGKPVSEDNVARARRRSCGRWACSLRADGSRAGAQAQQPAARPAVQGRRHRPGEDPPAHHAVRGAVPPRSWSLPLLLGLRAGSPGGCSSTRASPPRPTRRSHARPAARWSSRSRSSRPASTSSATPPPPAAAAPRPASWAPGSTWSGRRSTPTSPTPTGSAGSAGCAPTSAASTSTRSSPCVTVGVWWVTRYDAILLLVATQILQMLRQLLPFVRFDGYHVLADLTGVPDLFHADRPDPAQPGAVAARAPRGPGAQALGPRRGHRLGAHRGARAAGRHAC